MSSDGSSGCSPERCAVVTGANKGIGFEICKQLACHGITVVLTSRDVQRGTQAVADLLQQESSSSVVFHQLDVTDPASIASLAHFITARFGKLDILVNNAAVAGAVLNSDAYTRAAELCGGWPSGDAVDWNEIATQTYELGVQGVETNYYGAKRMVEALVPLLKLSGSPRIVNVSSNLGLLQNIPSEWAKGMLGEPSEEKVDRVIKEFLKDLKEGVPESKGWPPHVPAYIVSKAAMNAYTRVLANKLSSSFCVNSVCPGYVKTDITCNTGLLTPAQGAHMPVTLALLPNGGPSGLFFREDQVSPF